MSDRRGDAVAGWIIGATFGFGLASFGWWNPYLSLFVTLSSFAYLATYLVATKER